MMDLESERMGGDGKGKDGLMRKQFSNQEWYERRGYQIYNRLEKAFSKVDATGKSWYWNAVFLKKEIC